MDVDWDWTSVGKVVDCFVEAGWMVAGRVVVDDVDSSC